MSYTATPGVSLYEEARGRETPGREPLLCLHGWGMNLRAFEWLSTALEDERRVLSWDLPGHGRSGWHDSLSSFEAQIAQLREGLPRRCALLGWSLGGQFALELAARCPTQVTRLVLVTTTPRFEITSDWPHGIDAPVLEGFATQLADDYRQCVQDFLELQVRGTSQSEEVLGRLQQMLLAHGLADPRALAADLHILRSNDLRDRLERIRQPTLVIGGQYDRVTPPAAVQYLASRIPGARHVELRRAGHAPFLSHADEVLALLREFLAAPAPR